MPFASRPFDAFIGLVLLLGFYLFMGWRVVVRHKTSSRTVLIKLIVAAILLGVWIFVVALAGTPFPTWRRIVGAVCSYSAALMYYDAISQMLSGDRRRSLSRAWTKPVYKIGALVALYLGLIVLVEVSRGDRSPAFNIYGVTGSDSMYYIEALMNYTGLLVLEALIVATYWHVLRKQTSYISLVYRKDQELVYIACFALCLVGFTINTLSLLLVDTGLTLSWLGSDGHPALISILYPCSLLVTGLCVLGAYTLPDRLLVWAVRPLDQRLRKTAHEGLRHLHAIMVRIVPQVQFRSGDLQGKELQGLFLLLEISEARRIIWSHEPRTTPIRPQDEVVLLTQLIADRSRLLEPGTYRPAPLWCLSSEDRNPLSPVGNLDLDRHNAAVARQLKRLDAAVSVPTERSG